MSDDLLKGINMRTIVAAAVRIPVANDFRKMTHNGKRQYPDYLTISAPPPARHGTLMHPLHDYGKRRVSPDDQGFLTSDGEFVSREEAYVIARDVGQELILHGSNIDGVLYSEDLW